MKPPTATRRRFLQATAAIAAPAIVPSSVLGRGQTSPGNRITIGVIGLGGMGTGNLKNFLGLDDAQVVAVCDVHDLHYRDRPPFDNRRFARYSANHRLLQLGQVERLLEEL